MSEFHILVIEDNPADIELWREAFKEALLPFRMTVLSDGEEATQYICDEPHEPDPVDLILLDINLPRVDGLALLESIKETRWCASVPVVVTTSSSSPKERSRVSDFANTQLLIKPSNLDDFLGMGIVVKRVLEHGLSSFSDHASVAAPTE